MTPHLNRLVETVQMRGHSICFYAELTKIIPNYHQMLPLIYSSADYLTDVSLCHRQCGQTANAAGQQCQTAIPMFHRPEKKYTDSSIFSLRFVYKIGAHVVCRKFCQHSYYAKGTVNITLMLWLLKYHIRIC